MLTEDEREKRREGSPEWHRARANSLWEHARRWPRSMSRSRERLSSGGNSSGRNSASRSGRLPIWNVSSLGGKMPRVSKGRRGRRPR